MRPSQLQRPRMCADDAMRLMHVMGRSVALEQRERRAQTCTKISAVQLGPAPDIQPRAPQKQKSAIFIVKAEEQIRGIGARVLGPTAAGAPGRSAWVEARRTNSNIPENRRLRPAQPHFSRAKPPLAAPSKKAPPLAEQTEHHAFAQRQSKYLPFRT